MRAPQGFAWVLAVAAASASPMASLAAQVRPPTDTVGSVGVPPRPDSIRVDSTRPSSVVPLPRPAADTLKRAIAAAEVPVVVGAGTTYRWDRDALFTGGAISLLDLLERVPGLTGFRIGVLTTPQTATYIGAPGRVRLFYDGIEQDGLGERDAGAIDLSTVELWTLEEVLVERGADELRVYLRSWRTDRTAPYTRTDVYTGDDDTNLYRGFYGKRFGGGQALQAAFQQFSTDDQRLGGGGDQLSLFLRTGVARGRFSADVLGTRLRRSRDARRRDLGADSLPSLDLTGSQYIARGAYGSADSSALWGQLVASIASVEESGEPRRLGPSGITGDSLDPSNLRLQYLAAAGSNVGGLRLSLTGRARLLGRDERFVTESRQSPLTDTIIRSRLDRAWIGSAMARAAYGRGPLVVSALGERVGLDSAWRGEVSAQVAPLPFLIVSGVAGLARPDVETGRSETSAIRGELGLRVHRTWVTGGVLRRDSVGLPPLAFEKAFVGSASGPRVAYFVTARGPLLRGLGVDANAMRWQSPTLYQPRTQARTELYLRTSLSRRFPSGNFGFLAAASHEYRAGALFPVAGESALRATAASNVFAALVEIRLLRAVITYNLRNALGAEYEQVPGYSMPRSQGVYGVRWEFWN